MQSKQCLHKYKWVKLPRSILPPGKGIMGDWAKLAARAAYRKGNATYCGHTNPVTPGMWAGGICGIKAILKAKNKKQAETALERLSSMNYIAVERNMDNKYAAYTVTDWVTERSGKECKDGTVYATDGYGFVCLPRNITERMVQQNYVFEEADAWVDLWCHTVSNERRNAFSFYAPVCQYDRSKTILTLETLGKRWNWEKTKVWRFFQKHSDIFALLRLPGSLGCLIFNMAYPSGHDNVLPGRDEVAVVLEKIRSYATHVHKHGSLHEHMSRMIAWFSGRLLDYLQRKSGTEAPKSRIALLTAIYRAYISPWICRNCYDCGSVYYSKATSDAGGIRGPCYAWESDYQNGKELLENGEDQKQSPGWGGWDGNGWF